MSKYIEPRIRRDFGGIMSAYFDFVKGNYKGILNSFIAYNGVLVILTIICAYFMITGLMDYAIAQSNWVNGGGNSETGALIAGLGVIALFLILGIGAVLNYSIASTYVSVYEKQKISNIDRKTVWKNLVPKIPGVLLYLLIALILYFIHAVINVMLGLIPVLGTIVSIFIALGFNAWLSLTIFSYIHNEHNVIDAFGEAWNLLFSAFWKSIGVNFLIGLILQLVILSFNIIPGILIGIYIYNVVDGGGNLQENIFGQILLVVFIALFCLSFMLVQVFSQSVNGFLYFNLHEYKYNNYLRTRIEKLGEVL